MNLVSGHSIKLKFIVEFTKKYNSYSCFLIEYTLVSNKKSIYLILFELIYFERRFYIKNSYNPLYYVISISASIVRYLINRGVCKQS